MIKRIVDKNSDYGADYIFVEYFAHGIIKIHSCLTTLSIGRFSLGPPEMKVRWYIAASLLVMYVGDNFVVLTTDWDVFVTKYCKIVTASHCRTHQ